MPFFTIERKAHKRRSERPTDLESKKAVFDKVKMEHGRKLVKKVQWIRRITNNRGR